MGKRNYTIEQFEEFKTLLNGQFRAFKENKNYPLHGIKRIFDVEHHPFSHQIAYDIIDNSSMANDMISCLRKGDDLDLYFEKFVNMLNNFEY